MSRLPIFLVLFLLAFSVNVVAQETSDKQSGELLRDKAFKLMESLARESGTLQSGENRARMASNLADSLWKHNEIKARELFASVATELKAVLQSGETKNTQPDDRTLQTFLVFMKLREDTVNRIAKYDSDLALSFLKETKPIVTPAIAEKERQLELRLATLIASENPDKALELGRKSLKRGLTSVQIDIVRKLARKSPDNASLFYKDLVAEIRNKDLREWSTLQFTQRLVQSFIPRPADESTMRELGTFLIDAALRNGCHQTELREDNTVFCVSIGRFFHFMERADPQRASALNRWSAGSPAWQPEYSALEELGGNESIGELLAFGDRFPQFRDSAFNRVIMSQRMRGEYERAREIAKQYPGDPARRQQWLKMIDQSEEGSKVSDERFAQMLKEVENINDIDGQLNHLMNSANLGLRSNRKGGLKLLDKANELLVSSKPGEWQTKLQIELALEYCLFGNERCLSMVEPMVGKLNELVAAAAKLDGFDNHYLRDNEWNMTGEGGVGSLLTLMANNAHYFAWYDFDRSLELCSQFERPEIRMMAQLKLAQGIMSGPPDPLIAYVIYDYDR
jgi:hypothetical protein